MRFFMPAANNKQEAETSYQQIRHTLSQTVEEVSTRRIYRLRFEAEGGVLNLAVGDAFRRLGSEPVLAILDGPEAYWIYTYHHGGSDGEPYRVPHEAVQDVEEFTAIA